MARKPLKRINFGELGIGYRGVNNLGYWFTIIGHTPGNGADIKPIWMIRFDSGHVVSLKRNELIAGVVKDRLSPTLCGVGIFGYPRDYVRKEYDLWKHLIMKCYSPNDTTYFLYGAQGVTVCERWHRFDYFLEDMPYIDGYDNDLYFAGKLDLDKDMKQMNLPYHMRVYSPQTCTFLSRRDNLKYTIRPETLDCGVPVTCIDQNGNIIDYTNKRSCLEDHNITRYILDSRIDTNQPYQGNRYYTTNDTRIIGRRNIEVSKVFDS